MMEGVTAIFDIGKTNKKFFLFDKNFKEVYREYQKFEETTDEDGDPVDDLLAIQKWAKELFRRILKTEKYEINAINFSTYGASLVYIDKEGKPLTPLYNYTKEISQKILDKFFKKHGSSELISSETASPNSGMLSSGIQLFWLKETQPEIFKKIKYALHLPQYLSFIFTGIPLSEFTSIGCHTMLWDYNKADYHKWVYDENLESILAPIVDTDVSINMNYEGKNMRVGVGIHDSSAALLPYLKGSKKDFTLVSTGTWSVALNPFNHEKLTKDHLAADCLNYMSIDGDQVSASRLFLGHEHKVQNALLATYFKKNDDYHKEISFNGEVFDRMNQFSNNQFAFVAIQSLREEPVKSKLSTFSDFESAYHRLVIELTNIQIVKIKLAEGKTEPSLIYIDGGFVDNEVFIEALSRAFPQRKIMTSKSALGSSLGAALVISNKEIGKKFLKKKYGIKKYKPLIFGDFDGENKV